MSKSEGNIIDPLEMIEKYGTDALRFTLAALAVPGMDLALSEERMAGYQAFANKIWNASRFVLMNLKTEPADGPGERAHPRRPLDPEPDERGHGRARREPRAIQVLRGGRPRSTISSGTSSATGTSSSPRSACAKANATTEAVLADALDRILRLLHPFMPFITEEIWQHLPGAGRSIALAPFPEVPEAGWKDEAAEKAMALVQEVIVETRTIRAENKIAPKEKLSLIVKIAGARRDGRARSAGRAPCWPWPALASLEFAAALPEGEGLLKGVAGPFEIGLVPGKPADLGQERERLKGSSQASARRPRSSSASSGTRNSWPRRPAAVVEENRTRLDGLQARREKLGQNLAGLTRSS